MKPEVHYAQLEDMKKYVKGFDPDNYESSCSKTDASVVSFLREYYSNHLPVDVTAWARVNEPSDRLIYKNGFYDQICFVRDMLCEPLFATNEEFEQNLPMVISTHTSKSIKLPVYQINLKNYGLELILRYNFYDWKVSIKSSKPLDCDFMGLFDPNEKILSQYCEGFPKDKIYDSYSNNHSEFTVEFRSKYELYTFVFLIKNYLGIKGYND